MAQRGCDANLRDGLGSILPLRGFQRSKAGIAGVNVIIVAAGLQQGIEAGMRAIPLKHPPGTQTVDVVPMQLLKACTGHVEQLELHLRGG